MPWVELFVAFLVCHLVGDYLLQTDWQALGKYGGLTNPAARGPLLSHVSVYTLCFTPVLIEMDNSSAVIAATAAAIFLPHFVIDDGRAVSLWMRRVKHADAQPGTQLYQAVDQSFHVLFLFLAALAVGT